MIRFSDGINEIHFYAEDSERLRIEVGEDKAPIAEYILTISRANAQDLASWLDINYRYEIDK